MKTRLYSKITAHMIFAILVSHACISTTRPEMGRNMRIIARTPDADTLNPPSTTEECGRDVFIQREADGLVFEKVAEKLKKESCERGKRGEANFTPEEITTKALTGFREEGMLLSKV